MIFKDAFVSLFPYGPYEETWNDSPKMIEDSTVEGVFVPGAKGFDDVLRYSALSLAKETSFLP